MSAKKTRISLLTNMIAPYRVPLLEEIAGHSSVDEFRVLTCADREVDREWRVPKGRGYSVKKLAGYTLNARAGGDRMRILHLRFGIFWELLQHRPARLIIGDASWTSYLAVVACLVYRIPYVIWNEITSASKVRSGAMRTVRKFTYRHARSCIASGRMAKRFLLDHECDSGKITIANNAVDNQLFISGRKRWEPERAGLREELGLDSSSFAFLYVGQLISRKRILETLEACAKANEHTRIHLLIAGSGPLESRLRQRTVELGYQNARFLGHVDVERLIQLYVACDGVVLLSDDEPWGMVINEAMLFGKPYLASTNVAAAVEFEQEGAGMLVGDDHTLGSAVAQFREKAANSVFQVTTPPCPSHMAAVFTSKFQL